MKVNNTPKIKSASNPNLGLLNAIYSRRAVRHFADEPVSTEAIEAVLDAAVQAPSVMNEQPWAFLIIQNKGLLKCISNEAREHLRQHQKWHSSLERVKVPVDDPNFDIFYGASTLITICARKGGFEPIGECYLAGQNLMLAAMAFDLATCPVGLARSILQSPVYRKELSIPDTFEPVLPIAIGYSASIGSKTSRQPPHILNWKCQHRR